MSQGRQKIDTNSISFKTMRRIKGLRNSMSQSYCNCTCQARCR